MIIGKIEIQLNDLYYHLNNDELAIIHQYLNGNKEIETVRQVIEIIARTEVTLSVDEEFSYYALYEEREYNPVSEEQLQEFIKHKVIDPSKEVSSSYYSNFLYEDGKCIDIATGKDIREVEFFLPCLIEFSYGTMISYYIFEWDPGDGHNFEIED